MTRKSAKWDENFNEINFDTYQHFVLDNIPIDKVDVLPTVKLNDVTYASTGQVAWSKTNKVYSATNPVYPYPYCKKDIDYY